MNSTLLSVRLLGILILAVLIMDVACGSLEFQDDRSLQLTWDQVESGVDVFVCNYGNSSISSLKVALNSFNFQVGEKPLANEELLKLPFIDTTIDSMNCTHIQIKAIVGAVPDPGKYNGQLIISGKDIDVIRKDILIDVKANECALDSITINVTRNPITSSYKLDNPLIPIKAYETGYVPDLPKKGTYLGFVQHDGNFGKITVGNEDNKKVAGVTMMSVGIEGLNETGTYSGKVYLAGLNNNISTTPINVRVTDNILFPSLAILVGLFIPIIVIFLQQRLNLEWKFKERRNNIAKNYDDAETKFKERYNNFSLKFPTTTTLSNTIVQYTKPKDEDIRNYQYAVDRALRDYTQDKWLLDPNSKEFKKVIKMLEDAENDAALMGALDEEGLGASLKKLKDDVNDLVKFIFEEYPTPIEPSILTSALSILHGRALQVGEARKIKEKARSYSDFIKKWIEMAKKVKRYSIWVISLQNVVPNCAAANNYETDYDKWRKACYKIFEVINELLEIKSVESLEEMGSDKDLKEIYSQLSYLGSKYKRWMPIEEANPIWMTYSRSVGIIPKQTEFEIMTLIPQMVETLGKNKTITNPIENWLPKLQIAPSPTESFETVEILKAKRFLGDGGVLLVSFSIAMLVGLNQLYFGKTFGSLQDYVTALLLGATTETLLNGIKGAIKQRDTPLRSEDDSSEVKKK